MHIWINNSIGTSKNSNFLFKRQLLKKSNFSRYLKIISTLQKWFIQTSVWVKPAVFRNSFIGLVLPFFVVSITPRAEENLSYLHSFSDPAQEWEKPVEVAIEEAYRQCFKTYVLGDQVITVRMPFAENDERSELTPEILKISGGGKANPVQLWETIDGILASEDFFHYMNILQDGTEKVLIFDLTSKTWTWTRDLFEIARMKAGAYRGLPHRPYVLVSGNGLTPADVYNYLYCVGRVGMDCSGFVWYVLNYTAKKGGVNLEATLRRSLKIPARIDVALYIGTWFFDSNSKEVITVPDTIENLQSGDILVFRGSDGTAVHSAIIQSIDFKKGRIRYLQSTDEAPLDQRGVHESFILFDSTKQGISLKDPSLVWTQKRYPAFPGEHPSAFSDDGERYRAYPEFGGGKVVRLKAMVPAVNRLLKSSH